MEVGRVLLSHLPVDKTTRFVTQQEHKEKEMGEMGWADSPKKTLPLVPERELLGRETALFEAIVSQMQLGQMMGLRLAQTNDRVSGCSQPAQPIEP